MLLYSEGGGEVQRSFMTFQRLTGQTAAHNAEAVHPLPALTEPLNIWAKPMTYKATSPTVGRLNNSNMGNLLFLF
jgi:hypothetical protein